MIRTFKYLFLSVFLLLLILALFMVYISSTAGEALLAKIVTNNFNKHFDHQLRIDILETNIFSSIRISGVSITSCDFNSTEFVSLKNIDLNYRLLDLIKHRLLINSINIDGLSLSISTDTTGSMIVPRLISPPAEKAKKEVSFKTIVRNAVVQNSRISYEDKKTDIDGIANNISFLANRNDSSTIFSSNIETILINSYGTDYEISGFYLTGSWSNDFLKIKSLGFKHAGLELTGCAGIDVAGENFPARAELFISGKVDTLASNLNRYIPAQIQPITGTVNIHLSFTGSKSDQSFKVRTDIPQLTMNTIDVKNCNLTVTATKDSIIFDSISMGLMDGYVEGEGYLCLDSVLTHKIAVCYRNFPLDNLHKASISDRSLYKGIIDGSLVSSGELRNPQSLKNTFFFSIRDMSFSGQNIPPLSVKTTIKKGTANIKILQDKSLITSKLNFSGKYLDGEFNADIPDIETYAGFINIEQLTGSVKIKGKIAGFKNSPHIFGEISGRSIKYFNFPLDAIEGGFDFKDGKFALGDITFTGALDDLSDLELPVNVQQLSGSLSYRGKMDGRLENLTGEISLSLDKPSYGGYRFNSADAWLKVGNNRITLDSLSLFHNSCRIAAEGSFGIESLTGDLKLGLYYENDHDSLNEIEAEKSIGYISAIFDVSKSDDIVFEADGKEIALSVFPKILGKDQNLDGTLKMQLFFRGNPANPSGTLTFSIIDAGFDKARVDSIKGVFNIEDSLIKADSLLIYYKNNKLYTSVACRLERDHENRLVFTEISPLNGFIRADSIDISLADEFLQPIQLKGLLNGHAELSGTLREPHINGNMEILRGGFLMEGNSIPVDSIHLRMTMLDTIFIIDDLSGNMNNQYFSITGKAASSDFREFISDFTLSSQNRKIFIATGTFSENKIYYDILVDDFDISLIQGFAPGLAALQGKANASVIIQGSMQQPEFLGKLRIDDFSYQPDYLDAPFTNGIVKITFNGCQVDLDSAYVRYRTGHIYAAGSGKWGSDGFTAFLINVKARQINFHKAREFKIDLLSSDLNYELADNKYRLDGDLIFGESRVLHRFQPEMLLKFLQKTEKPAAEMPAIFRKTVFNVRVRESENIWIDNNLAKLRLHLELALTGTPARPNLNGRLSVQEGYVYYLDRRFSVMTGILDFADPVRPNPVINLLAETSVRNYRSSENETYQISLNVTGPLGETKIELFSEPPLDRPDILSLLTLGFIRERSAMDGKDSKDVTLTDAVKERLEEASSSWISGYFAKKAESTLGLSQFSVEGNLFNVNNKSGPQLVASRRLSKRMELTYITTVGHMNEQGICLDYILNKHFSVEGQTDQTGKSGVDLKYRIKY